MFDDIRMINLILGKSLFFDRFFQLEFSSLSAPIVKNVLQIQEIYKFTFEFTQFVIFTFDEFHLFLLFNFSFLQGEKPYACPLCLKSYRTIGNFNSHVKTHDTGTRPHRCELCNQTFPIPKDWYSHLRSSHRSRIPSSTNPNPTTTVTQPLFSNALSSHQQHSEIFVPNKVKLEPINRSQLIIKSSNSDDLEPVNMSKRENDDEDEEEEEDENFDEQRSPTRNLLSNGSSTSVVHV